MKYFAILLLLLSCSVHNKPPYIPSNNPAIFILTKSNPNVYFDIEEIIWQDSSKVSFLTLTFTDLEDIRTEEIYSYYCGPIKVWDSKKSCFITSIFTSRHTGYFLIDDFDKLRDSLTITISGRNGEQDKSQSYTHNATVLVHKNETNIDSLMDFKSENNATKKWYKKWKINNPLYEDERTKSASQGDSWY